MKRIRLEVAAQDALRIADGALPAVSKDSVTPVLTGAQFTVGGNHVQVMSTDRYRVHRVQVSKLASKNAKELDAIVPAHVLAWLSKVSGKLYTRGPVAERVVFEFEQAETGDATGVGKVTVTVHAEYSDESAQITASLIRGNFPPVGRLIDGVKRLPDATKPRMLTMKYLTDVQKAVGRYGRVVIRHTDDPGNTKKQSPTHVWCDGWFEALIQPHLV